MDVEYLSLETNFALSLVDYDMKKVLEPLLLKETLTYSEQKIVDELAELSEQVGAAYLLLREQVLAREVDAEFDAMQND